MCHRVKQPPSPRVLPTALAFARLLVALRLRLRREQSLHVGGGDLARPTGIGTDAAFVRAIGPRFATRAAPPRDSVTATGDETRLDSAMPGAAVRAGSGSSPPDAVRGTPASRSEPRARAPESRASRTREPRVPARLRGASGRPHASPWPRRARAATRATSRATRARRAHAGAPNSEPENAPCPSRGRPLGRLARSNDPSCTIWANAGAASASAFSRSGGTPATSESVGGSFTFSANDANAFAPSSTRASRSQKYDAREPAPVPATNRNARPDASFGSGRVSIGLAPRKASVVVS